MKKLVLLLSVLSVLVFVVPASAVIFYDGFNTGWGGPDSLGTDPELRLPINWDRYADIPGNAFLKLSTRAFGGDLAMVLSQWGTNDGITTYNDYAVVGGSTLDVGLETKSEGWGWLLTLNVKGIFKNAVGDLTTVVSAIGPDLKPDTSWTARSTTLSVPSDAVSAKFVLENYRSAEGGENGGLWVDNFTVTPEPMTVGLLGLGALLIRRRKA